MIPNTEVLQHCAQNGIEHHIKRAQLRWSGHLVRMADDRTPPPPRPCSTENRTPVIEHREDNESGTRTCFKATLKACCIPHNTWEATATDRALWCSTCHSGLRDYGEKRCDALSDKIMRRKAIQPSSNIDACVMSSADSARHGSACIATTKHMPTPTLTEVEIRRTDGSLHIMLTYVIGIPISLHHFGILMSPT